MLNQVVLVGRIAGEIHTINNATKITLAVNRDYINEEGIYETDFIYVLLRGTIGTSVLEYCKQGDLIGIKGRLQQDSETNVKVIADKVSFLSSRKEEN